MQDFFFNTIIPGTVWKLIILLGFPALLILITVIINSPNLIRVLGAKFRQRKMDEASKYDKRPPVLYLRSFNRDGSSNSYAALDLRKVKWKFPLGEVGVSFMHFNYEYYLARKAEYIGPFIAIGNPSLKLGREYGASRDFYLDQEWQEQAYDKMKKSSIIIIRLSDTGGDGVTWELEQLMTKFLKKTVFLLDTPRNPLDSGYVLKYLPEYNGLMELQDAIYPCFLEFLDDGKVGIYKDIAQTSLYRTQYHLSRFNKHFMYCTKCGAANKNENIHCSECGDKLRDQKIPVMKTNRNPFISIITSDVGYFLIAILFISQFGLNYWWQQRTHGAPYAEKDFSLTIFTIESILSIIVSLILVAFTTRIWRQVIIFIIAVILTSANIYYLIKNFHDFG